MIVLVTGTYPIYDQYGISHYEFMTSHGVREETGEIIVTPNEHPMRLGARYDEKLGEWIIEEEKIINEKVE